MCEIKLSTAASSRRIQGFLVVCARLLTAAVAGWTVLATTKLVVLLCTTRILALIMSPDLLPSLLVVIDMGALAACGWMAGRVGRPRVWPTAILAAAGLSLYDFTPYLPLNVPWVFRLAKNTFSDSRYVSGLSATLTIHALMLGSLFAGAQLSRPRRAPMELGIRR